MPKLFDEFDLDLKKIKNGIGLYNSDGMTLATDCVGSGSGSGSNAWDTITCLMTCGGTCVSDCFCPSENKRC